MEDLNNLPNRTLEAALQGSSNLRGQTETLNGMKGVAMSAGRQWIKEIYVGFLLLLLSFLYLSHLSSDLKRMETEEAIYQIQRNGVPVAEVMRATQFRL